MKIFISTREVSRDLQGGMPIESLYQVAAERNIELEIAGLRGDRITINFNYIGLHFGLRQK